MSSSKRVLITGTSTGIGRELALQFAQKGFEVTPQTWLTLAKLHQSGGLKDAKAEEFDSILDSFKDEQKDLQDYVKGELDPTKELEVGDKLVEMYQELEPTLSKDDIDKKVMQMEVGE
jgi:NAD(P)-dependent dehydrogenase (short-subunit alcohol dehydrogenase family)